MVASKRTTGRGRPRHLPGLEPSEIDLRDTEGRLCARRAAKILGVSLPRLAGMVGCKPESLGMFPLGPRAQRRLRQIERIIQILRPIFLREAGFRSWLRQRREAFGGKSPLDFLDERKTQLVVDIAEDILIGNPI